MGKHGIILPTILIILVFVSIASISLIRLVNANTRNVTLIQRKFDNQIDAGNVFFSLVGYFQSKYNDSSVLNMAEINTFSSTDTLVEWYSNLVNKMSNNTLEDRYWLETFEQFQNTYYLPTSAMKSALEQLSPDVDIDLVVRPHKIYPNLLFVVVRTSDFESAESVFWGMISPRYFSNWAVFLLEGVNSYYYYGEFVDGPSYYGGRGIGAQLNVPPLTEEEKENPAHEEIGPLFNGNMMNRQPWLNLRYNNYTTKNLWVDDNGDGTGDRRIASNTRMNWTEYDNKYYLYYGSNNPAYGVIAQALSLNGNNVVISNLLTAENVNLQPSDMEERCGVFSQFLPWYFQGGVTYIDDSIHSGMVDKFDSMMAYYQGYINSNKVSTAQSALNSYFSGSTIGASNLGVYFGGATSATLTYEGKSFAGTYYIQNVSSGGKTIINVIESLDYNSIEVLSDVLKGQDVRSRYGIEGFSDDTTYSVQEYWYRERYDVWEKSGNSWTRKKNDLWRDTAQVVVTASSEFEGLPVWDSKTFFVIRNGQENGGVKLLEENLGPVDMEHAGVFMFAKDLIIGKGGLYEGTGHDSKTALFDGRFSLIAVTGNVKVVGDIIYNDLYPDLRDYKRVELINSGIDLNRLVAERGVNDMVNLVAIDKDIYMPHNENNNNQNIKIMSNIFAFGNRGNGSFWIERFSDYGDMGYRHIFGTIVAKTQSATFSTSGSNIRGFREYNIYDDRLYSNEDLPVATPESSLLMAFGFGMR